MRVFITGGTGLIGRNLVQKLLERGDEPVVLSRQSDVVRRRLEMRPVTVLQGDPTVPGAWDAALDGCDAVVNLAGHNIFQDRWDPEVKRTIRDSRVYSTEHVVEAIEKARSRPRVLVQASAIGYYGPHGDEELTEDAPSGSDFLATACREWEDAAQAVGSLEVRLATIRIGVVLARDEGALGVMGPIFRWGGGAPVGGQNGPFKPADGNQWMSWIHIDDVVGLILLAIDRDEASGPINGTAPNPVRNREFGKTLARALWRPFLPFGPPDFLMERILGEVAQVVTRGQRVLPSKALRLGYRFQHPDLAEALRSIYAVRRPVVEEKPARQPAHSAHH